MAAPMYPTTKGCFATTLGTRAPVFHWTPCALNNNHSPSHKVLGSDYLRAYRFKKILVCLYENPILKNLFYFTGTWQRVLRQILIWRMAQFQVNRGPGESWRVESKGFHAKTFGGGVHRGRHEAPMKLGLQGPHGKETCQNSNKKNMVIYKSPPYE